MDSSLDSDLVNCKMVESLYTQNKRLFPFLFFLFPFPQNIPRKGEEKEVGFTKNEEKDWYWDKNINDRTSTLLQMQEFFLLAGKGN